MPTPLDQVIADFDPARVADPIHRRADEALNAFPMESARVTDYSLFIDWVSRYCLHMDGWLLGLRRPAPMAKELAQALSTGVLLSIYGANGEKAAFEIARTGKEGGVVGIAQRIASHLAEQRIAALLKTIIRRYWNSLSAEQQLAAGDEYLAKWGYLLPDELRKGGRRVCANLPAFLEKHAQLIERTRRTGPR